MSQTILLLASDSGIRKAIGSLLESKGYFVLTANSIGRAVEYVKECKPDLFMVGHYTASLSGHDAAMFMRRACPGISVLLVGGLLKDPELENRESLRNFEVFPKPYEAADLLDRVKDILTTRSLQSKAAGSSAGKS